MTIHYTLSTCCFWSAIMSNALISELMMLSAICRDTRKALEREGMPVMVRRYLHTTRMTRPLHGKLRWVCIRFPSLRKQNVFKLRKVVKKIIRIPTVVKVELDLDSIELGVFRVFRLTMLRLCKALEYKSLSLRCRIGCYHYGLGFSRWWYGIDESGLLDLLQECMCFYSISILLRYKHLSLNPDDVLAHLGLKNID